MLRHLARLIHPPGAGAPPPEPLYAPGREGPQHSADRRGARQGGGLRRLLPPGRYARPQEHLGRHALLDGARGKGHYTPDDRGQGPPPV